MKELNFSFLFAVLKKHWWKIIAIALAMMLLAALFTHFLIPKKYSSAVKFYVVNINTDLDYTSATYLAAADYLVNDYIEIIHGDLLLTKISNELSSEGYEVSASSLRGMIHSDSAENTSVFTLTVTSTDKKLAYRTAELLAEMAPPVVTEIAKPVDNTGAVLADRTYTVLSEMKKDGADILVPSLEDINRFLELRGEPTTRLECITILKAPVEATTHDSPNLLTNTILAGLAAAILSYGVFLIISTVTSCVVSEEELKALLDYPIISSIPHWETNQKKERRAQE